MEGGEKWGMGYLSFDCSCKIKYSGKFTNTKLGTGKIQNSGNMGIAGYIHHIDRKNYPNAHPSNPDINSDLTLLNESYTKTDSGEWKTATNCDEMKKSILRRLDYAKEHGARIYTSGKNDTVILRPLVVQLDSDVISEHENWVWDIIKILEKEFGADNITGFSVHKDESNPQSPHLHICFVPCYETEKNGEIKCTISQTKFFKNPKQLAGLHKKIRKALIDKGYDIEIENKPIEEHLAGYTDKNGVYHQKGLPPQILKELSDRQIKLQIGELDMNMRKSELDKLEQAMNIVKENAKAEKAELEKERISIENDRATVAVQLQTLIEEKTKLEKMREEVYSTAEICSNILSDEKNLNAKFMEFLEREGKRTGKKIRETVENLYKRFQNERKKNVSDWQLEMLRLRSERLKHGNTNADNSMDIIDITDTGYDFSA